MYEKAGECTGDRTEDFTGVTSLESVQKTRIKSKQL